MKHLIPLIPALMSILWGLICLRIYTMISRENGGQRRVIAIAAGLGGALVYLAMKMLVSYLLAPMPEPEHEPIRVQLKSAS